MRPADGMPWAQYLPLLALAVVAAMAASTRLLAVPRYDEDAAVLAARLALAAYAGYHHELQHATAVELLCPSCSLRGLNVNVSTVQQRTPTGVVTGAALVGRVGSTLVLAFAGDSPDGFNPLSELFALERLDAHECAGMQVYQAPLAIWRSIREEALGLLASYYSDGATGPLRLSVSGYSLGASVAPVAALDIALSLSNGSLPTSRIRLGPVHTFGNGAMGNLPFIQCFDRWVGQRTGHFGVIHGRDPLPFMQPSSWHKLTPAVFYDGPGGNETDWHSHNYTICAEAISPQQPGCDEKYGAWERNPVHVIDGFCSWHTWYAGLSAVGVFCGSTTERGCAEALRVACAARGRQTGQR